MSRIIACALRRGTDPRSAIAVLRDENLSLQEEKRRLLAELGLPEDALDETPACPLCGDTGYRNGEVCQCLRAYCAREQQRELSRMLDLGSQSFDTFDLSWYSDRLEPGQRKSARQHMEERVYNCCAEYASHFGRRPENLLLFGAPGLGKTHLSAAIAREVSERGFSVVYDTAGSVFEQFEDRKFGREEDAAPDVERVLRCDLLILDDLGSEMTTAFVQSALYRDRQHPAGGAALHHHQHEPDPGGHRPAVHAPDRLPDRGGVHAPALCGGGHPEAEEGAPRPLRGLTGRRERAYNET